MVPNGHDQHVDNLEEDTSHQVTTSERTVFSCGVSCLMHSATPRPIRMQHAAMIREMREIVSPRATTEISLGLLSLTRVKPESSLGSEGWSRIVYKSLHLRTCFVQTAHAVHPRTRQADREKAALTHFDRIPSSCEDM